MLAECVVYFIKCNKNRLKMLNINIMYLLITIQSNSILTQKYLSHFNWFSITFLLYAL